MKPVPKRIVTFSILLLVALGAAGGLYSRSRREDIGARESGLRNRDTWQERVNAAFTSVDCPVAPRVFEPGAYTGPMIDAHVHIAPIPDGPPGDSPSGDDRPGLGVNVSIEDYVCMMNAEGTKKALAFFPVWEPTVKPMIDVVQRTMASHPDRFIPFIMPPDHDDSPTGFPTVTADALSFMLAVSPDLFRGYGEIGLYARNGGSPELPPDAPRLTEIYPIVREYGLLVYVHLGRGQKDSFERVLRDHPDITFLFHGDQLIEDAGGGGNLQLIDEILANHPNVRYGVDELYGDVFLLRPEVSKETFLAHFENPEPLLEQDLQTWKAFLERHPDQVLWDTDRGWSAPWSLDPEVALTLNTYSRAFIGRLDPAIQEKFAFLNAEKLAGER